jgi:uncharacterized protein YdeI (YjbR/CyaY-like superfamily)
VVLPVADLREALIANPTTLHSWKDITPLARNEFIRWVENAKQEETRERGNSPEPKCGAKLCFGPTWPVYR